MWWSSCSRWWSLCSWWSSSSSSWSRHAFPRLYVEWQVTNRWRDAVTNWRTGGRGAVASSVPPDLCHFIQRINCPRLGSGANTDRVPGKGGAKPQNLKSRISRLQPAVHLFKSFKRYCEKVRGFYEVIFVGYLNLLGNPLQRWNDHNYVPEQWAECMFEFCDSSSCVTLNKFDGNWTSKLLLSVHMSYHGNFWRQENILDKFECHSTSAGFSYSDVLYSSFVIA